MTETRLDNGARLINFRDAPKGGRAARSHNFTIEWAPPGARATAMCGQEALAVFLAGGGRIARAGSEIRTPAYSVAILPAGTWEIAASGEGAAVILTTDRSDLSAPTADPRVTPVGAPYRRRHVLEAPEVRAFDDIPYPADNPRLKFLQSAVMSLNLVVYDGPRDRTALSPHAHAHIEQGSLALEGDYVHHLRTPWGPNAEAWREDAHVQAAAGSLLLIPPELIHTSEGVGAGRHVLLDIFAPPRRDFLTKGWVANAADYAPPPDGAPLDLNHARLPDGPIGRRR